MGLMKRHLENILDKQERAPHTLTAQDRKDLADWYGGETKEDKWQADAEISGSYRDDTC